MKLSTKGIFCASLIWSSVAFGDAMPSCPPGEMVQMNPVQPGAFHHAGGKCVPDPTSKPTKITPEAKNDSNQTAPKTGGCAVSPESSSMWLLLVLSALLASRRKQSAITPHGNNPKSFEVQP